MKVLLAGNTGYVTEEFVEEAFPEWQVMVLGNKMLKTVRRRNLISRPFPRTELELGDIFRTYEFEAVVYFSNYLTLHGELEGKQRICVSSCNTAERGSKSFPLRDRTRGNV